MCCGDDAVMEENKGEKNQCDLSRQSGLVDLTVTKDNPIIFRSMVTNSEVVPFVEENHDITAMTSQFQQALMPVNQPGTSRQIALPFRGGQGSTSLTPVEITGGEFDAAHIGDKNFNATKNVGVAGGDFRGAHFGAKYYFCDKSSKNANQKSGTKNSTQPSEEFPREEEISNVNSYLSAEETSVVDHERCQREAHKVDVVDSTSDEITLLNDVWMSLEDATIVSLFCKDDDSLSKGHKYLEPDYKRVIRLPGEVFGSMGNVVKVDCQCTVPPDSMKLTPDIKQLKLTKTMIRKRWHQICFKPSPHPGSLMHTGPYEMSYLAKLLDCEGKPTEGGFSADFNFRWPFCTSNKEFIESPCQACGSCSQNSCAMYDARKHSGCQKDHAKVNPIQKAAEFAHTEIVPEHNADYASFIKDELGQSCEKKAQKDVVVTPEGSSVKQSGGKIHFRPGAVSENAKVTITVNNDPDRFPGTATTVSSSIECKTPKLAKPMCVELTSWLTPKSGERLKVQIVSTTQEGRKRKIREIILGEDGDLIKYEASHFCWHVAVVSTDDAKNAICHLYNDVWMDVKYGRILSVFYRDEKALRDGSMALEKHHKRIIPMPGEIIAGTGSKIVMEFQCRSPAGMTITSIDGENAQLEIAEEMFKKRFSFVAFRCIRHPEKIQSNEPYDIFYQARVISDSHPVDGGFSSPLSYKWPILPSNGHSTKCEAVQDIVEKASIAPARIEPLKRSGLAEEADFASAEKSHPFSSNIYFLLQCAEEELGVVDRLFTGIPEDHFSINQGQSDNASYCYEHFEELAEARAKAERLSR